MNKRVFPVVFLILLFITAIAAVTEDLNLIFPKAEAKKIDRSYEPAGPARWFRSNAGGMALKEVRSRLVAMRNSYALAIISVHEDEMPDFLIPYYDAAYTLEIRALYNDGEQIRTQWLFKDTNGVTRLNAVFLHKDQETKIENKEFFLFDEVNEEEFEEEGFVEVFNNIKAEQIEDEEINEIENETDAAASQDDKIDADTDNKAGFIEIFNEKSVLTEEYRFYENGQKNKTEYEVKENLLISAVFMMWEGGAAGGYKKAYTDFYRYNRSLSLRSIERVFYKDMQIPYNQTSVSFRGKILDVADDSLFIAERFNLYPEYFGDVFIYGDSKMIYETDEKGRIITQTLYDEENNIIWIIQNSWTGNRIVSTNKKEGDLTLLSEFQYNSAGDRIMESNYRNGILERIVRTEGKTDIEELYIDNALVLRAVWEDGIMISETRVRN